MTRISTSPGSRLNLQEFCRYIPLRLSANERALLTVLENTLHVSEYTDNVDVASNRRGAKARRILDGILEACHIATGLVMASGQEPMKVAVVKDSPTPTKAPKKKKKKKHKKKKKIDDDTTTTGHDPKDSAALLQTMFEIGRRNKVLNPSSMRTTYGKLMYLLQDAQSPTVARSLGFSLYKDLVLVQPFLEQHGGLALLQDDRLVTATQFIPSYGVDGQRIPREEIECMVQEKRQAAAELVQEYSSPTLSEENVQRVVDSIADAVSYVQANVAPVRRMLHYLQDNFDPHHVDDPEFSLQISGSSRSYSSPYSRYGTSAFRDTSGATLSHSHSTQYTFVWQSLRLWQKVQENMHKLWICADDDLLSTTTPYHLNNTGQGLNRVQSCPRVGKVMRGLLGKVQHEAGAPWVGLSVVHLGDRDVPNALMFIDKYTQIPRFLKPVVDFLDGLPQLCQEPHVGTYIEKQFGSEERLKMLVLTDWCKHSFDGSGDDGGSCIDGRITSSWNWTSRLAKKKYYHAFMLSGFQGFDGDFK